MNRLFGGLMILLVLYASPSLHAQPQLPEAALSQGKIESMVRKGLFPLIRVGERDFLIDRSVAVQWTNGSDADRSLLQQGMPVQLEFHRDGVRLRRILIQVD